MLLVKKWNFFLYLFSVKKRIEIRFNDVLDRKETFLDHKNKPFSTSQKWHFSKGVNPCFWSKNAQFFCIKIWSKQNKKYCLITL